mmetsp:Transcript_28348/g.60858  ORF Transcript_28348/g.60858 Transcript_28348/m.60858 type:complete len:350 (-) Transcript_28348:61-1110(-)
MSNQTVTIFTSIGGIAQSLRDADPNLPIKVVEDDALNGDGVTFHFDPSLLRQETRLALKQAKILISEPAVVAQLLEHDASALSSLCWCQSIYAGVDPIFNSSLTFPLSWKLTRFAGCLGPPIAEWCLGRIIAHERNFMKSAEDQKSLSWAGSKDAILGYRYLSSLTLAVLGCGDIGRCIAKLAKAFGMKTVGYGKTSREPDEVQEGIDVYTTNLDQALWEADYIVSVLPSTPETRGLLNGDALRPGSKPNGRKCPVFINAGRGDIITEDSLLNALDNQWISASILDVFEVEPLPKESKLWHRSDVIISPHVSGWSGFSPKDVPKVFLKNYERFLEGSELKYLVDWNKGY